MYFYIGRNVAPIWAEEGVAQGDTLGLLYFCIAQAEVTEATKDTLAEEGIMIDLPAYADNVFIPPILTPIECAKVFNLLADNMNTMLSAGIPVLRWRGLWAGCGRRRWPSCWWITDWIWRW